MTSDDDKKSIDDSRSRDLSPGKLLVWARERAELTQEQVAKELYMTLTKVRSLELDDYRHMGADTFVRGYLRAYANLVHLDVSQVLAAYDRFLQKTGTAELAPPRRSESESKPIWQFAVIVLTALFILWLISIWFFDNRQSAVIDRPAAIVPQLDLRHSVSAASSSAPELVHALPPTVSVEVASSATAAEVQLSSSIADSESTSSLAATASENAPLTVSAGALAVLTLKFNAECWLEVSDARGDVLAADLQAAGSSLQLQGEAPFDVKLGNAPAASISLNGELIAITPLPTTNVLSLKVGQ